MKNNNTLLWSISLMVIGVATLILAGSNIIGIELHDVVVRISGIVVLIALPVLAYTTVKKFKIGEDANSMIDLKNGMVKITDDLRISPNYSFDEFKKTSFYNNQDGVRVIDLEKQQFVIDGINYLVSFFFKDNKISVLSLVCCGEQYSEENEKERKKFHDEILKKYGVIGKKKFAWGSVSSDYDTRGNCSSINFLYF